MNPICYLDLLRQELEGEKPAVMASFMFTQLANGNPEVMFETADGTRWAARLTVQR